MLSPLSLTPYFDLYHDLTGWVVWLLFFGVIVFGMGRSIETNLHWKKRNWIQLIVLSLLVILTSSFIGVRLTIGGALPRLERNDLPGGPALMFFAALPWMLAAGWLGVLPATILGAISGLIIGLLDTHNLFTPLEMAGLALLGSLMLRQVYRTLFFRFLRHPLGTAIFLTGLAILVSLIGLILSTSGALVSRVDYGFTNLPASILAIGGELIIAGLIAEIFSRALPYWWGPQVPLAYSPAETRLQLRFFAGVGPWVGLMIVIVMVGDWFISENAAHEMLEKQLGSTARVASAGVPFLLESGQNLITQFAADDELQGTLSGKSNAAIQGVFNSLPFFRQLSLFDGKGSWITGYPQDDLLLLNQTAEERLGIKLALKGVKVQTYSAPPLRDGKAAQVAFIASIQDPDGKVTGVLWGRVDLASNPLSQPVIKAIDEVTDLGGEGQIIDENGRILYDPMTERLMDKYQGRTFTSPTFFDEPGTNGTRQLVYYQPVTGRDWSIILTVPASQVQQLALQTAVPLFGMILAFTALASLSLIWVLRKVTASLVTLSNEAGLIAKGQFDQALPESNSVDEVGQLSKSFEKMRVGLKNRMEELNRLLMVSQGVASTLEIKEAVLPILNAALANGASLARIVLQEETLSEPYSSGTQSFSKGTLSESYAGLDEEIMNLARQRGMLIINNLSRGRSLNLPVGAPRPAALSALSLRHENQFYGVLWISYSEVHTFSEEELRFLSTLAAEAALAAANARLYETAEIGRQQLEAILSSTPDPVLVTDQQNRILLTNPAFIQLPGLAETSSKGQSIQEAIGHKDLINLISQSSDSESSREIKLSNGRIYYASISSVTVDSQTVGKICILRDITHYKELDTLKSEFVATVSHDLRSPLTLMRGYATMLPLVGELNEQQKTFVRRIVSGIENMSRLVSNLLDLGRIEAGVGLKLEKVAPSEILERVTGLLQLQAAQKNIQFEVTLPEGQNPIITADGALLQQALYNLVENAIKYTPLTGQVKVSLQLRPNTVVFMIRDTGIGIAPLDQPRLFEKFYRGGQREAHQQRGTGLGLAIVKSIAEKHGGKVWLESQLGKGSTFYLEIPINPQPVEKVPLDNRAENI